MVALDDPKGDPRLARRMDATLEIMAARRVSPTIVRVPARGETPLARVLSSAYVGDAASFYLAVAERRRPQPGGGDRTSQGHAGRPTPQEE